MPNLLNHDNRSLMLIELNEVNFDIASRYLDSHSLPAFRRLFACANVLTLSEQHYEQLEPWIQWPSVHSGKSAHEHDVFRLGDMVGAKVPQMFEQLEQHGLSVGCISAMNAENRMRSPAYFIPDPWTKTPSDTSWWSRILADAISQTVNDNARSRISAKSALHLLLALLRFAKPKHYGLYWKLVTRSRRSPWRKALVLDLLLHDIHSHLFSVHKPHFSTLFLNAGAHIQHHYFFNSQALRNNTQLRNPAWYVALEDDPIAEMLQVYDLMLGECLDQPNTEMIVATGLSQKPYDHVEFYYRLKDHAAFLRLLGISFLEVLPRMTRDFLIEFGTSKQATEAKQRLSKIKIVGGGEALFSEIDNRGASLFVTLTYPNEIDKSVKFELEGKELGLAEHVAFVAIKNGMHQAEGFAFFSSGVAPFAPKDRDHVKELYSTVMRFFGVGADRLYKT